jgi:anti-sigma regulatory factor (Ser/Thr protein kinase)
MRISSVPEPTPRALGELRLPADASKLRLARAYARQTAAAFGLDGESCDELVFAVNEAVTNAIRHGTPDEHGSIGLLALADGEHLTISVHDYGTFAGAALSTQPSDAVAAEGGRGFALMTELADTVELCVGARSTTVHLSKARR